MIMWAAPIGAFGAIAAVVGETGVDALKSLAVLMLGFYATCALFVFVVLGTCWVATRREHLLAAALPRPRVPAHPVDVVVGVGAARG
jgi:aerobic C4-dicarboxylate transport protein